MNEQLIEFERGVLEYGDKSTFIAIVKKYVEMTFIHQLDELYVAMKSKDFEKMQKVAFILKGSTGQILALGFLERINRFYEFLASVNSSNNWNERYVIDLYHYYFDVMEESVLLSQEISEITYQQIDLARIQKHSKEFQYLLTIVTDIQPIYYAFIKEYCLQQQTTIAPNPSCQCSCIVQ